MQLLRAVAVPAARQPPKAAAMPEAYAGLAAAEAGHADGAAPDSGYEAGTRADPWPAADGGPAAGPGHAADPRHAPDAGHAPDPRHPATATANVPALSASEARALIELMSARGIAQGELAGLLGLDKSTVSRLAAGLERKGWVRRGRDEGNQRYVRLYLTQQGGEIAARVWQAWQSRQARLLAALSDDERAGLSAGLRGLVRGLAAEGLRAESPDPANYSPDPAT
jgi:DNA-binding MarR family transcriptional regulator